MGQREFSLGTHHFDIFVYDGKLATSVKNHCFDFDKHLSAEHKAQIDRVHEEDRDLYFKIYNEAWGRASEEFWEGARERARKLGLGLVFSEGRSGGWLCLHDWTESHLDNLKYDYEDECLHCDDRFEDHLKGKCLFDTSMFESPYEEWVRDLNVALVYLEEMSQAAANADESVAYYITAYLEDYGLSELEEEDEEEDD